MQKALELAVKQKFERRPVILRCKETDEVASMRDWAIAIGEKNGSKPRAVLKYLSMLTIKGPGQYMGLTFVRVDKKSTKST